MMDKGVVTGHVEGLTFVKQVKQSNILRVPEQSFTIDQVLWDEIVAEGLVRIIRIDLGSQSYWLKVEKFEELKQAYDYGNGAGYRVPVRLWNAGYISMN